MYIMITYRIPWMDLIHVQVHDNLQYTMDGPNTYIMITYRIPWMDLIHVHHDNLQYTMDGPNTCTGT